MKNTPEYVLCAAIWYKEFPLLNPKILENSGSRPYNCDEGVVISGWRHFNCIAQMAGMTALRDSIVGESIQGFLTSKNRFLTREEAAIMAYERGQIESPTNTLYSEDLY